MVSNNLILNNLFQARELEKKYSIPLTDILLISLNCMGIKAELPDNRIRFKLKPFSCDETFYFAVCVNTRETPFELKNNRIYFNNEVIGDLIGIEEDTCDSTYFRRNKTTLTLNSNSRSKCAGCKFCGTYNLEAADTHNLLSSCKLSNHLREILSNNGINSMRDFIDIGVCTGCFPTEEQAINHLLMLRETLKKEFDFNNEIKYLGAQINSKQGLMRLSNIKPFAYYYTIECFTHRKEFLKPAKRELSLNQIKDLLWDYKNNGFQTSFLYILGLDPLESIEQNFSKFKNVLTRFPIINVFQNYVPEHEKLRHKEARTIEYYLKARKIIEKIFIDTNLRPRSWENYRGLWYLTFGDEKFESIRI